VQIATHHQWLKVPAIAVGLSNLSCEAYSCFQARLPPRAPGETSETHNKHMQNVPRSRETTFDKYLAPQTPSDPCSDIIMVVSKRDNGEEANNGEEEKAARNNRFFE
jgi:hypothetical protein